MWIVVTYAKNGKLERQSKPMYYEDALALYTSKATPSARKRYVIRKAA